MPFSTEFWVGTAITFVIAVIGVAVAIAMDAKTKGEFGFVVGCFLTSAAIVVYGIGTWQMNTTLAAKYRIPLALILFAGVAMGTIEVIRWAHGRHLRAESNRSSSGGEVNVPATSVPAPIRSAPPATVAVAAPTKPKHERKESSVPDNSLSSPDIPSVPEENTSALYRPYFSNVGTGGFSRDDSDNSVYLKVPLMNNSLHSAFDLVIK